MAREGWICPESASILDFLTGKAWKCFFRTVEKLRLRNASKNNCGVFSMFTSWALMKMKLEITFACIMRTNLREKTPIYSQFYRAFQINTSVHFVFSVIANKL